MDNKPIVINGVDVSSCDYYGYEGSCKLYSGSSCTRDCKEYNNCYYKQLARKIQKCKQAEQKLNKIREVILNFSRQDIITLPDFEPIKNYEFIQKQCNKPILEVLQIIDEVSNGSNN